jgi:ABC-type uncharacterized transport system involved in gliding motility auxiliary subunit
MNTRIALLGGLIAAAVLFLGINILGNTAMRGVRADLTQGRIYTLTSGSRRIAAALDEPITLKLFFTPEQAAAQPMIKSYYTRVSEMLREYAAASGGKIKLRIIDPKPFSEEQDEADQNGLMGAPMGQGSDRLYFGLVGENSTDQKQVIPFFDPQKEEFLEYDVTRLIYLLSSPQKKAVGLLCASLPIEGMEQNPLMGRGMPPWQIVAQMKDYFDVRKITPDSGPIPDDVKVLMVVHPKNLSDKTQYAIDQFVMRGGRLLVFVDPYCEADTPPGVNPMQAMGIPKDSNLTKLFDAWGIEMAEGRVAADLENAIKAGGGREGPIDFPVWIGVKKEQLNRGDPVTGGLENAVFTWCGVLSKKQGAAVEFEPLITTSTKSETLDAKTVGSFPPPDYRKIIAEFQPSGQKLTLAARITGTVSSAFPAGDPAQPPPAEGQAAPQAGHLAQSKEPANIIVVADCDFLSDRLWVREQRIGDMVLGYSKFSDNGDFVIGAIDHMSGSTDLMSVRARVRASRPFDRVESLRKDAERKYLAKQQELQQKLDNFSKQLTELLRQQAPGSAVMLTPEQQAQIATLRKSEIETRKELRKVQSQLRADIDRLGRKLEVVNIAAMPAAVGLAALGISALRVRRKRTDRARTTARS